jgi:hypothetical protein
MEKHFSASDICSIVKSCGENGVGEFTLGKLKVTFKGNLTPVSQQEEVSTELQEAVSVELTERDELAHKEAMLAQMEIEDPVEFERLMTSGDLINSKVGAEFEGHSGAEQAL